MGRSSCLTDGTGTWVLDLVPNSEIAPSGSVYSISIDIPGSSPVAHIVDVPESGGPYSVDDILSFALTDCGVVNAGDYLLGDGSDEGEAIAALLSKAARRQVYFPAGVYATSTSIPVPASTEIFGDGNATEFRMSGTMLPLFTMLDAPGCSVHDIAARYTGTKTEQVARVSVRGGAAAATNAVVWTNSSGGTFKRITSYGFCTPISIDNWDGSGRSARCSGVTVETLAMYEPVFGLFVAGCSDSSFSGVYGYDPIDLTGDPPHAVYVTNSGSEGSPYQRNLRFTGLYCRGSSSSGFQFKGMVDGTVSRMTAEQCGSILTCLDCERIAFSDGVGLDLVSDQAYSGMYCEHVDSITISGMTLRYAAGQGGTADAPHRGPALTGDNVTITGLDIEFPLSDSTAAAVLWFGALGYDTSGYSVTDVKVSTPASVGAAAAIRNASAFALRSGDFSGPAQGHIDFGSTAGVVWSP